MAAEMTAPCAGSRSDGPPDPPVSSLPQGSVLSSVAALTSRSEQRVRLVEHDPQDLLDLVEVLLVADQRRRQLDHRVAPVIGPAVEALAVQGLGQESPQQLLGL